jgi:acyl carrier protein
MSDVELRVKHLIIEKLDVQASEITYEASFIKDLGVDSLDLVELLMTVEEEFGIDIPDEEIERITTVGSLIEYVTKQKR